MMPFGPYVVPIWPKGRQQKKRPTGRDGCRRWALATVIRADLFYPSGAPTRFCALGVQELSEFRQDGRPDAIGGRCRPPCVACGRITGMMIRKA